MEAKSKARYIEDKLAEARAVLRQMEIMAQTLENADRYDHPPSNSRYETRNGSGERYLTLYWPKQRNGPHLGPAGKRKQYIGSNPERIAEAGTMIENGRRYDKLCREITWLERHITSVERSLAQMIFSLDSYTYPAIEESFIPATLNEGRKIMEETK